MKHRMFMVVVALAATLALAAPVGAASSHNQGATNASTKAWHHWAGFDGGMAPESFRRMTQRPTRTTATRPKSMKTAATKAPRPATIKVTTIRAPKTRATAAGSTATRVTTSRPTTTAATAAPATAPTRLPMTTGPAGRRTTAGSFRNAPTTRRSLARPMGST